MTIKIKIGDKSNTEMQGNHNPKYIMPKLLTILWPKFYQTECTPKWWVN